MTELTFNNISEPNQVPFIDINALLVAKLQIKLTAAFFQGGNSLNESSITGKLRSLKEYSSSQRHALCLKYVFSKRDMNLLKARPVSAAVVHHSKMMFLENMTTAGLRWLAV